MLTLDSLSRLLAEPANSLPLQVYIYDPTKSEKNLQQLLKAAGAKVLSRLPLQAANAPASVRSHLEADPHSIVIVAGQGGDGSALRGPPGWTGICVKGDWLIDSASNYCVQPFQPYML